MRPGTAAVAGLRGAQTGVDSQGPSSCCSLETILNLKVIKLKVTPAVRQFSSCRGRAGRAAGANFVDASLSMQRISGDHGTIGVVVKRSDINGTSNRFVAVTLTLVSSWE